MPTLGAIADAPGAAGALLVVDAVTDDDLRTVSRATAHLGLVTGAAGLVLGLTGPAPATPAPPPPPGRAPGPSSTRTPGTPRPSPACRRGRGGAPSRHSPRTS